MLKTKYVLKQNTSCSQKVWELNGNSAQRLWFTVYRLPPDRTHIFTTTTPAATAAAYTTTTTDSAITTATNPKSTGCCSSSVAPRRASSVLAQMLYAYIMRAERTFAVTFNRNVRSTCR